MAYFHSGERRNYFVEFGTGRPVVLLHGISNSGRAWAAQIGPLVRAGYRVIVPDQAGHGASSPVPARVGIRDLAADVVALLDQLALERADVVGLSMGGMVALALALDAAHRVQRLVLANTFANTTGEGFQATVDGWAKLFRAPDGPVTRFEQSWPINVNAAFRDSDAGLATYQSWHAIAATLDGGSLAHVAEGLAGVDVTARLPTISAPTCVIGGSEDRISPIALNRAIASAIPGAGYVEIDGAAH